MGTLFGQGRTFVFVTNSVTVRIVVYDSASAIRLARTRLTDSVKCTKTCVVIIGGGIEVVATSCIGAPRHC